MSKVAVLMAVGKGSLEWLKMSIRSVLDQTFEDFEFLIVNDCPGDTDTGEVLDEFCRNDCRIRLFNNIQKCGLTRSLNTALRACGSGLIARMDSDDISLPQRLAGQVDFLERHSEIFLVGSDIQIIDALGKLHERICTSKDHTSIKKRLLQNRSVFYHPAIMFRNEGFLYRENFDVSQDYDFYLNLLSCGKQFAGIGDVLLHYRISDCSISMDRRRRQVILKKLALHFYRERLLKVADSYDLIEFDKEERMIACLDELQRKDLEMEIAREEIVAALKTRQYLRARIEFNRNGKLVRPQLARQLLWVFTRIPWLYEIYRRIRQIENYGRTLVYPVMK